MKSSGTGIKNAWERAATGTRLWWAGMSTVGLAVVMVSVASLATASGGGASATSTAHSGSQGAAPNSDSGRAGSRVVPATGSGAGMPPASMGGSSITAVCPNVKGTTAMPDGMMMAPVPTGAPTAAQQAAAKQLVAETDQALTRFSTISAAEAAGYVPATNPSRSVVHYANWSTVASGDVLDPMHPSSLVYANTVSGPVLLGAMYMGSGPCQPGPDVGGSLTQWHAHANLCLSATHQVVGHTSEAGTCASGIHNTGTYFMLHVWTAQSLASTHQFTADLTRAEIAPIVRTGQP